MIPMAPPDPDAPEPRRPNVCFESLCEFETAMFSVRVWRTEKDLFAAIDADDLGDNADIYRSAKGLSSARAIFQAIVSLPRIAAVQVCNKASGATALCYPDWGNERP